MKRLFVFTPVVFFVLAILTTDLASAQGVPANIRGACPGNAVNTAIGCIPVGNTHEFAGWFLGWAIGIAGGLALMLIVFSGFQIMTAQGDPQKLQAGRELLTSAISGLILIIFSMFLLRLIGVKILNIPGIFN